MNRAEPLSFSSTAAVDPTSPQALAATLRAVPARWCVYLMSGSDGSPIQLLCVKNLRSSLRRRLEDSTATGVTAPAESGSNGTSAEGFTPPNASTPAPMSRRADLRGIVRRISWTRVDSAFEADIVYLRAARQCFPDRYSRLLGYGPAWFLHVDPSASFPRYVRTTDLSARSGFYLGPVQDRASAGRLIEELADWFDLCRYYNVLCEAPHGAPCAYKDMGKCPAPCDGTISMPQYRNMVDRSLLSVLDPQSLVREHTERMKSAAAGLKFEAAAKIKSYLDSLAKLGRGAFRHVRTLEKFQFLTIQPGPREGCAKALLITPGQVEELAGIPPTVGRGFAELVQLARARAADSAPVRIDSEAAELISLVAHHLFQDRPSSGAFIPIDALDERAVEIAYDQLTGIAAVPDEPGREDEEEGVIKELG